LKHKKIETVLFFSVDFHVSVSKRFTFELFQNYVTASIYTGLVLV